MMWSDKDLSRMIEACKKCLNSGHKALMMPADKLVDALGELQAFRVHEDKALERFNGDIPSE